MKHTGYIVAEGVPFILVPGVGALAAFLAGLTIFAALLLLLTLFIAWFFRNPERTPPENLRQLVSPADGRVIAIEEAGAADPGSNPMRKVSIFMNVFNVHVNRMPCTGDILSLDYKPGKFLSADLDKASEVNERNTVHIRTEAGKDIKVVQIAGLIARRIVCWVGEGMRVQRGERFGLIRFGSRVELFLPGEAVLLVKRGDRVRAGETPIGELP